MDDNKLLREILNDEEYCDVIIEVGNDPHKNDGTLTYIKLSNILPEIFQIILRYIYCGNLPFNDYDASDIIKILIASSELCLQELITSLQSFMIEKNTSWIEKNLYFAYQTSIENNSLVELREYCTDLITNEPNKLFKSPNFPSASENLLISIIQNDNLQISDVQIWENILKWGLAQNQELPSDITNFSKNDFKILKDILQQYIPFIKFYNFTCKEFSDKVLPYKKVLSKDLYKDLLKTFLTLSESDRELSDINLRTVDSKIITYKHAELISKWINRLNITDELTSPFEFKLLFRGSRDGLTRNKFHRICNNKSRTVTIIKVKDSSEILGGYNPIEWKSDESYGTTKDSFIFSFSNNDGIENYILSRIMNEKHAIFNSPYYGPTFGEGDLILWYLSFYCNYCVKTSYINPIRKTGNVFTVEECEVFQII
ncbi:carbohydrate-binding module family 13 protein [Rhizophagus irregularis DAOM 181602=DAOM 197198]|nr:carbohydrate-binding module family 13 protein [Rhizophagus irregularis DAOM 181602=DAOM 197198]